MHVDDVCFHNGHDETLRQTHTHTLQNRVIVFKSLDERLNVSERDRIEYECRDGQYVLHFNYYSGTIKLPI